MRDFGLGVFFGMGVYGAPSHNRFGYGKHRTEVEGVEDDVSGHVMEGVLESVDDLCAFIDREAFVRER